MMRRLMDRMNWQNKREELKKELCEILTRIGSLKFGMFTLSESKLSPYYIDLRIIPSFPKAFERIEKLYREVAKNDLDLKTIKRIAGIPTAGIPFSSVLAFSLNKPFLFVRRETASGRKRRVEGILNPGDRVLIVDDLITTGKTILAAAEILRSEGSIIKDALVLIDRQEGGKTALKDQGIQLHHLIRISEAGKLLYNMGAINKEQLNSIQKQIVRND
jgi:orotate phosphoribosyltransferase